MGALSKRFDVDGASNKYTKSHESHDGSSTLRTYRSDGIRTGWHGGSTNLTRSENNDSLQIAWIQRCSRIADALNGFSQLVGRHYQTTATKNR